MIGYIVGFIVLSVGGTFVQLKYVVEDEDEGKGDDFMSKEDM